MNYKYDLVEAFKSYLKAAILHRESGSGGFQYITSTALAWAGFPEVSERYLRERLELSGDSSDYFLEVGRAIHYMGNIQEAHKLFSAAYRLDSNNIDAMAMIAENYLFQKNFEASLSWYKEYLQKTDNIWPWFIPSIGYAFMINGYQEEADYYLKLSMENNNLANERGTGWYATYGDTYYWLAACHAAYGQTEEVLKNLRIATRQERLPLQRVNDLNKHPIYDKVRSNPGFQQIVRDVEAKYQAEHERVRQYLEENDML
jgi:tetratricopeptide (TPR) repeat protein